MALAGAPAAPSPSPLVPPALPDTSRRTDVRPAPFLQPVFSLLPLLHARTPSCDNAHAQSLFHPCPCAAEEVLERDFFMSAPEAREFGIVDEVIEQRPAGEAEALLASAAAAKLF